MTPNPLAVLSAEHPMAVYDSGAIKYIVPTHGSNKWGIRTDFSSWPSSYKAYCIYGQVGYDRSPSAGSWIMDELDTVTLAKLMPASEPYSNPVSGAPPYPPAELVGEYGVDHYAYYEAVSTNLIGVLTMMIEDATGLPVWRLILGVGPGGVGGGVFSAWATFRRVVTWDAAAPVGVYTLVDIYHSLGSGADVDDGTAIIVGASQTLSKSAHNYVSDLPCYQFYAQVNYSNTQYADADGSAHYAYEHNPSGMLYDSSSTTVYYALARLTVQWIKPGGTGYFQGTCYGTYVQATIPAGCFRATVAYSTEQKHATIKVSATVKFYVTDSAPSTMGDVVGGTLLATKSVTSDTATVGDFTAEVSAALPTGTCYIGIIVTYDDYSALDPYWNTSSDGPLAGIDAVLKTLTCYAVS